MAPEATALSPELRGLGAVRVSAWHAGPMRSFLRSGWVFSVGVLRAMTKNRLTLIAGGIAFFAALALAPTAFAFGAIASIFISRTDLEQFLNTLFSQAPGEVSQSLVPGIVEVASRGSSGALTASSVVAIVVAVYAASKVVLGLRMAVDSIFSVTNEPTGLIARGIAGVVAFVVITAFALIAASLTVVPRLLQAMNVDVSGLLHLASGIAGVIALYLALRAFYRHGPHLGAGKVVDVPWLSIPVFAATLWVVVVTAFFGLYVNLSGALGAAIALFGASIVFLVWLYVLVMGVLIGAQVLAISDPRASEAAPPQVQ